MCGAPLGLHLASKITVTGLNEPHGIPMKIFNMQEKRANEILQLQSQKNLDNAPPFFIDDWLLLGLSNASNRSLTISPILKDLSKKYS